MAQESICDYREKVSILFVLIHDFHVSDATAALSFLNEPLVQTHVNKDVLRYFGRMDDICAKHKAISLMFNSCSTLFELISTPFQAYFFEVTKIETVAEEYVCCVGVLPEDHGVEHQQLLLRLFAAAKEIQELQQEAQAEELSRTFII